MALKAIEIGLEIVNKLIRDPAEKARANLELLKLEQAGEFKEIDVQLQRDLAQIEVNKIEATSPNVFVSGWRPAAGWASVAGLVYTFLLQPLLAWGSSIAGKPAPPDLDVEALLLILGSLLGIGTMRSYEKRHRVTK